MPQRSRLRLMAVHAHPDDESSKGAATTAYYADQGVQVLVVTCTGGERGEVLNPSYPRPVAPEEMAAVRRAEMDRAAQVLGVRQTWLGFVDSGLPKGDPLPPLPAGCFASISLEEAAAPLVHLVRMFRPHVMTTYDPTGGYPHPDHVMTHRVAVEAYHAAADPDRYQDLNAAEVGGGAVGVEPWTPLKLYYHRAFSLERARALHKAMRVGGLPSPFADVIERAEADGVPEREVTTRIRCVTHFAARDEALRAHATQVDPEGFFFSVPRDVEARVWPVEEYELAHSRVAVHLPEDDLFAGIDSEGNE